MRKRVANKTLHVADQRRAEHDFGAHEFVVMSLLGHTSSQATAPFQHCVASE
jgi:hypothetical protein